MLKKRGIITVAILLILCLAAWVFAAEQTVDQRSVLAGKILAAGLAVPNTKVREGDALANVSTSIGSAVAARATVDGTIYQVLVKPGDAVKPGDVLVRIKQ